MHATSSGRGWRTPVTAWLGLLALVFMSEYSVMLLLPSLLPQPAPRLLEAAVDSVALTLVLAPALWLTIVRPLREVLRLRTQFLTDLFVQIESDRLRTATELHDGVGQALTLLISGLRSARACRQNDECTGRVNGFQRLAEDALTEVRRLALGLRPSLLDDLGLAPALERLVEDVQAHHPVAIVLDVGEILQRRPPDAVATAVFRIVQEGLANVVKHAQARNANVLVCWRHNDVLVEIGDDGLGMTPERLRSWPPGHLGLRGMSERAALLGGDLAIDASPGQGTRLRVRIPAAGAKA